MPAGLRSAFKPTSKYNWWYYTQAQKHHNNRNIQQPSARVLGGIRLIMTGGKVKAQLAGIGQAACLSLRRVKIAKLLVNIEASLA
jgi:hypothetical protein